MKINIRSIHFDATGRLQEYVKDKVNKLDMFYDKIIGAEVFLRLEKSGNKSNKIAEIKLIIPGNNLFSKKQHASFEEAVDEAAEALSKQLLKRKQKADNKRHRADNDEQ